VQLLDVLFDRVHFKASLQKSYANGYIEPVNS